MIAQTVLRFNRNFLLQEILLKKIKNVVKRILRIHKNSFINKILRKFILAKNDNLQTLEYNELKFLKKNFCESIKRRRNFCSHKLQCLRSAQKKIQA